MVKAIDAVESGLCSVKWAAEDYKIPRTTLQDRQSYSRNEAWPITLFE